MTEPTPSLLANALADAMQATSRLLVKTSDFNEFEHYIADKTVVSREELISTPSGQPFDFIAGDLPLGSKPVTFEDASHGITLRANQNWVDIYHSLNHLNDNGLAMFLIEPFFCRQGWTDFTDTLESQGFFFVATFRFAEHFMSNTSLRPTVVVFSRQKREFLFVGDIERQSSVKELADAFHRSHFGTTILDGLQVAQADFHGFTQLIIEREIHAMATQYKSYRQLRLVPDLAQPESISSCKKGDSYLETENAIYILKFLTDPKVLSHIDEMTPQHHNYFQVRLDPSRVLNKYLSIYFSSRLGKLSLQALSQGSVLQTLHKDSLANIAIPIPDLEQQRIIVNAHAALLNLEAALAHFRDELSLNPTSAIAISDSVETMLKQVNRLSESDEILTLIRRGESKTLEFKETLALCLRRNTKEKDIETAVLKTIAAFLNSQGGTLLIGVNDSGQVTGLGKEIKKLFKGSRDNLLKHLKNILKTSIGEKFYPLFDYDTVDVGGEIVLHVVCRPSDEPCFVDSTDFYVRTNPATDKLIGLKIFEYTRRRFPQTTGGSEQTFDLRPMSL
jgi:hypothetical protein